MKMLRVWLPVFAVLAFMLVPAVAGAQLEPLVPQPPPGTPAVEFYNLCKLGQLMQNIINFLLALSIPLAAALFAFAGFLYVSGGSNPSKITRAHKIFKDVLIGFLIVISGWLVINTILNVVFDNEEFLDGGSWFELQCISRTSKNPDDGVRLIGTSISDLINLIVPDVVGGGGTTTPGGGGGDNTPPDSVYDFDPGIQPQVAHQSPALLSLLTCMAPKIPGGAGRISSISDNAILNGSKTWAQCRTGGQGAGCAHTVGSYHYGGNSCGDKSYAVDFGDQENAIVLIEKAQQCGGRASVHNGTHVHVSVGSCGADAAD